jgi:UDP-N-acetylmuramate dehydrogenase
MPPMSPPPATSPPAWLPELEALSRNGVQQQATLAPYTSFRIGGPADYLVIINRLDKLKTTLNTLHRTGTPFLMLGGGTNILISDAGVSGLVLINQCREVIWPEHSQQNEQTDIIVEADAGAPLAGFARESIKRGLAGLSWAVSIPGSVGGAIIGNAGAHGGDIASVLVSVQVWRSGQVETWSAEALAFAYRSSLLIGPTAEAGDHPVILSATFRLRPDVEGQAAAQAEAAIQHRRRTQPGGRSAGSIFRNPPGDYAGRLIEQAGLKGRCAGDACISEKHANFIINRGRATAADVMTLINLIRREVWRQFNVLLKPEILFIGDWRNGPALLDPRSDDAVNSIDATT